MSTKKHWKEFGIDESELFTEKAIEYWKQKHPAAAIWSIVREMQSSNVLMQSYADLLPSDKMPPDGSSEITLSVIRQVILKHSEKISQILPLIHRYLHEVLEEKSD
jgi:hypothetical protein